MGIQIFSASLANLKDHGGAINPTSQLMFKVKKTKILKNLEQLELSCHECIMVGPHWKTISYKVKYTCLTILQFQSFKFTPHQRTYIHTKTRRWLFIAEFMQNSPKEGKKMHSPSTGEERYGSWSGHKMEYSVITQSKLRTRTQCGWIPKALCWVK